MAQSATTTDNDPPNEFPIPSIVIIVMIFLSILLGMASNYSVNLENKSLDVLLAKLPSNTAIVGLATTISLIIYGYWFIYKFALRGVNDTNAIVYLIITVCLSIGTSVLFTNPRIMSFVNLNSMFENTIGIWFASYFYNYSLHELITYKDTKNGDEIHESVRSELAAILLSRYDVTNISGISNTGIDNKIAVNVNETVTALVDPQILQNLVALKYVVGYSCWMFFAAMFSIFWAISMFDGITP